MLDKLTTVAAPNDPDESARSISLAALLLMAKEKGAFTSDNYQLEHGWNSKTKEKAKRVITKMKLLMNDDEMKVIISDSIPQGGGYENWKQQFKEKAMSVQTKFLRDLTSRYDLLDEAYRNARGITRQGE